MRKSNTTMDRSTFHSWINWPNSGTRKCTKCGCMFYTINRKRIYEHNGVRTEEFIPCK